MDLHAQIGKRRTEEPRLHDPLRLDLQRIAILPCVDVDSVSGIDYCELNPKLLSSALANDGLKFSRAEVHMATGISPSVGPTRLSPRRRGRVRAGASRIKSGLQSRFFLGGFVLTVSLTLVVIHGLNRDFIIDQITLGLLIFASLPLLSKTITSLKAGNVELEFRDLSVNDQVFTFLDGIATKRQWTFFTPRVEEEYLGPAFVVLTDQLLKDSRHRLVAQLRTWLQSDDVNQRWFAAEIIGYHKITELRRAVMRARETEDEHQRLESWELNCLWAMARLDEEPYWTLKAFLERTTNRSNQAWILKAFDQMIEAKLGSQLDFARSIVSLSKRLDAGGVSNDEKLLLAQGLPHVSPLLVPVAGTE